MRIARYEAASAAPLGFFNMEAFMRTITLVRAAVILAITVAAGAACLDQGGSLSEPELLTVPAYTSVASEGRFHAHASGGEEVPAVDTRAQGQATFKLSADGTELRYRLEAANIIDVLMSHIHVAPAGSNGPIVAWLYPSAPPPQLIPGRFQGVLAEGVVTESDLMGPLAGQGLDALLDALRSGNAYVNVHTLANPSGEVRGQIR